MFPQLVPNFSQFEKPSQWIHFTWFSWFSSQKVKILVKIDLEIFPPSLISFHLQAFSYQNSSIEIDSSGTEDKLLRPIFIPERDVKFLLFTRRNPFVGQRILLGDSRSLFESNFNFSNPTRYKRVKRKWKCSDFMTSWNLILDFSVTAGVRTWIPSFWSRVRRHFCTTVISTW